MAPRLGLEPRTYRLTADCSANLATEECIPEGRLTTLADAWAISSNRDAQFPEQLIRVGPGPAVLSWRLHQFS